MLYPNELASVKLSRAVAGCAGDGVNARPEAWSALKAAKRPTIAHIITNPGQVKQALAAGATGAMVSPSKVHP